MNGHSFSHARHLTPNYLLFQDCFNLLFITTIKLWRSPCTRLRNLPDIHRLRWGCFIIHLICKLGCIFPAQRPAMITLMEAKIENCTIFACNVTAWIKCLGSYIFRCGTLAFIGFEDFFNSNAIPLRGGCGGSLARDQTWHRTADLIHPSLPYEWPTHAFP